MTELYFDDQFVTMMTEHCLNRVVILGHMNPDGDAAGCVMGLAHYIHTIYPKYQVFPYLSAKLDKGPKKQIAKDSVFQPFQEPQPEEPYGVIVCDTATRARIIGREYYEKAAVSLVIDHHASDEGYGDHNYTKISEACSENIYHALNPDRLKNAAKEPYPNAADYLYLGILHDTGGFSRANSGILSAGAELLQMGVDHHRVYETLLTQNLADKEKEARIWEMVQHPGDGKTAYVYLPYGRAQELKITAEDIHPISGYIRDLEGIELGFTMFEETPGLWRCSFRSNSKWINVNELAAVFGGGGHAAASGLLIETEEPEKLLQEILAQVRKRNGEI